MADALHSKTQKIGGLAVANDVSINKATIDYSKIGYYGRPITDSNRGKLLAAFDGLAGLYGGIKKQNEKNLEISGKKNFYLA